MKITVTGFDEKKRKFETELELTEVDGKRTWKFLSVKYEPQKQIKRKEFKNDQPSFERSLGIC